MRQFKDIKSYFSQAFADFDKVYPRDANHDPWYMFSKFIATFNRNRANLIAVSVIKLLDESMSAWLPRKDKTGGLPNISFILRKPEPLGWNLRARHALLQVFHQPCCLFYFILFLMVLIFL
jgi:hypothetical protein